MEGFRGTLKVEKNNIFALIILLAFDHVVKFNWCVGKKMPCLRAAIQFIDTLD